MRKILFIERMFPKKVVVYLLALINVIEIADSQHHDLSAVERIILKSYKDNLLDTTRYYVKTNLEFVKEMSPLVTKGEANADMQFLYSEILRMNPRLISKQLGNELVLKKMFK